MIRYQEIEKPAIHKTTTLEFWLKGKNIIVNYNGQVMDLKKFISTYEESKKVLDLFYNTLIRDFSNLPDVKMLKNKPSEGIQSFITNHLSKNKAPLDFTIHSNGKMDINIED